jgi:hypothetical protein
MTVSSMRRRAAAVAVSVLALLAFGGMTPAMAADPGSVSSSSECSAGRFCLWSGALYTGNFWSTTLTTPTNTTAVVKTSLSVMNLTGKAVRVFSGIGGSGSSVCYTAGTSLPNTYVTAGSVQVLTGTSC